MFSTREDLSIDVSSTNVGLILTKLRRFQLVSTHQNSILNLKKFKKKIKCLGFHVVVLVKTFPLMYQFQCRTDIDEAKAIPAVQHKSKYKSKKFNFEL